MGFGRFAGALAAGKVFCIGLEAGDANVALQSERFWARSCLGLGRPPQYPDVDRPRLT